MTKKKIRVRVKVKRRIRIKKSSSKQEQAVTLPQLPLPREEELATSPQLPASCSTYSYGLNGNTEILLPRRWLSDKPVPPPPPKPKRLCIEADVARNRRVTGEKSQEVQKLATRLCSVR